METIGDNIEDLEDEEPSPTPDPNNEDVPRNTVKTNENEIKQIIKDKILVERGTGELNEYEDHALNYNKSESMSHIIRGLTGLLGSLNYWFVDVAMGVWKKTEKKEKKRSADKNQSEKENIQKQYKSLNEDV